MTHQSNSCNDRWRRSLSALVLVTAGCALGAWMHGGGAPGDDAGRAPADFWVRSGLLREAHADLDEGEYAFFPNRRTIWVVNTTNGRMANYVFRDDEVQSVDRSRVAQLDLDTFPISDSTILLSDRNLNNVLWICNQRTGDVQMWSHIRDGTLKPFGPVPSSPDLAREPSK